MTKYKNYPLAECAEACEKLIANGASIFQKWTCEGCGERVTGNNRNALYSKGHHESCGHVTDLLKTGCNYMVIASGQAAVDYLLKGMRK